MEEQLSYKWLCMWRLKEKRGEREELEKEKKKDHKMTVSPNSLITSRNSEHKTSKNQ